MSAKATTAAKKWSTRAYYEKLPQAERLDFYRRGNLLKYGLTIEDYDTMSEAQGGVCRICGKVETRRGNTGIVKRLAVDHDHATGKVRGLLCHMCNIALGHFGDDPALLRLAAVYLENT